MQNNDIYVLFLVIIAIVIWLIVIFKKWLYAPIKVKLPFLHETKVPRGEIVDFLKQQDYEVVHGKHKVLLHMIIDDKVDVPLHSQYFIDYFAQKDSEIFIVKIARERKPIQWSGSSIRDQLLPLYLLYQDEVEGVLYVDIKQNICKKIIFALDDGDIRD